MSTILDKIKKAMVKEQSAREIGNIEEAESISAMITGMLQDHNLERVDVEAHTIAGKDPVIEGGRISFGAVSSDGGWEKNLINVVCRNNWCSCIGHMDTNTYSIIGKRDNIEVCQYLFHFLSNVFKGLSGKSYSQAILNAIEDYKVDFDKDLIVTLGGKIKAEHYLCRHKHLTWRKVYIRNYLLGAVQGLDIKLTLQRQAAATKNNNLRDLMIVNDKEVDKIMKEHYPDSETTDLPQGNEDQGGYLEGYNDGRNVDIHGAINDNGKVKVQKRLK